MLKKILFVVIIGFTLVGCQFTEIMVLNEDGSGRMTVSMDMKEMMAFAGEMSQDSTMVKMDTLIRFKDFLEEKKDSIATLSAEEQRKLKRMEPFTLRMLMDPEEGAMDFELFVDFKDVNEANDIMNGFSNTAGMMKDVGGDISMNKDASSEDVMGVNYAYDGSSFKRDAYIKDPERHSQQMDSLKSAESFMESMKYKLKYTFPKKIAKSNIEDARYSLDGKTIEIERSFIQYFKDPDVLDLEVELEN